MCNLRLGRMIGGGESTTEREPLFAVAAAPILERCGGARGFGDGVTSGLFNDKVPRAPELFSPPLKVECYKLKHG